MSERRNAVRCRCGVLLGRLTGHRPRWLIREPRILAAFDLVYGRAELVCPACGTRRIFRGDKFQGVILMPEDDALHSR